MIKRVKLQNKGTKNPLFEKWLLDWKKEAAQQGSEAQHTFGKALRALQKYPFKLQSGKECIILENFGKKTCEMLDKKLLEYRKTLTNDEWEELTSTREVPAFTFNRHDVGRSPSEPRKRKVSSTQTHTLIAPLSTSNSSDLTSNSSRTNKAPNSYLPKYRSGAYAILLALLGSDQGKEPLSKANLQKAAQSFCDSSFTKSQPGSYYTAWSTMSSLVKKELVYKSGKPVKYGLTEKGIALAKQLSILTEEDIRTFTASTPPPPSTVTSSQIQINGSHNVEDSSTYNLLSAIKRNLSIDGINGEYVSNPVKNKDSARVISPEHSPSSEVLSLGSSRSPPIQTFSPSKIYERSKNDDPPIICLDENSDEEPIVKNNLHMDKIAFPSNKTDSRECIASSTCKELKENFSFFAHTKSNLHSFSGTSIDSATCNTITNNLPIDKTSFSNNKPDLRDCIAPSAKQPKENNLPSFSGASMNSASCSTITNNLRKDKTTLYSNKPVSRIASATQPKENSSLLPRAKSNLPSFSATSIDSASCSSSLGENNTQSTSSQDSQETVFLCAGQFKVILLVDIHETEMRGKERTDVTLQHLSRLGVLCETRHLTVGDFLWIARDSSGVELTLPYVVERKRLDDMAASIKDGRFHEQKFRLKASGIPNIIYLVEKYGKDSQKLGLPLQSLQQAAANTQVVDQFVVKYTKSLDDSMRYLCCMSKLLIRLYKNKTLMSCSKNDLPDFDLNADVMSLMSFKQFNKDSTKIRNFTVKEMLIKQLLQLKGLSVDKATAIADRYPTPTALIAALENGGEKTLADLPYCPLRRLGPVVAKSIHQLYTQRVLQ